MFAKQLQISEKGGIMGDLNFAIAFNKIDISSRKHLYLEYIFL